jgi:hypothetical protein
MLTEQTNLWPELYQFLEQTFFVDGGWLGQ